MADKVVGYFGVFPERSESGVDPDGSVRRQGAVGMSRKGNDLVRAYLYNCARASLMCNQPCRDLYDRLKARGAASNVALGHVMAKLLRVSYALWATDRDYDPNYHRAAGGGSADADGTPATPVSAAGHKPPEAVK